MKEKESESIYKLNQEIIKMRERVIEANRIRWIPVESDSSYFTRPIPFVGWVQIVIFVFVLVGIGLKIIGIF